MYVYLLQFTQHTVQTFVSRIRSVDIDPDYVWNPHGNGLLLQSIAVPVVLLSGNDALQAWQLAIANRDSSSNSSSSSGSSSGVHTYPRHVISAEYYFGRSGLNSKVTSLMQY
jgi:D-aminopeptidase